MWTGTRLLAIDGRRRVEAVEVAHSGRREHIPCDGVVFTGRFLPEAALLSGSPIEIDPGTGGPSIDQHWRCSDSAYFAAGNLLRPIETAGVAWQEGRAAAEAIAAALAGALPMPERVLPIRWSAPLRYVYPQRLSQPGQPLHPLQLRARVARAASGRIAVIVNGREIWSRNIKALPERRIVLPGWPLSLEALEQVAVRLDETSAPVEEPAPRQSAIKPHSTLTERSSLGTVSD